MKTLALTLLFNILLTTLFCQVQIGNDIDGESAENLSGISVSLSADGTRVAVGAIGNSDNGDRSGHVRIYEEQNSEWQQVGFDIDGEETGDWSGVSVSLSAVGTRVAIGALFNSGNGYGSGHVRIFEEQEGKWIQVGSDIDGENIKDFAGRSVSLSADGLLLAISAPNFEENGEHNGYLRIYEEINKDWHLVASKINDGSPKVKFGSSISLSSHQNRVRVAVGAPFEGFDGDETPGYVRIYEEDNGDWVPFNTDIYGEENENSFGDKISLSGDGLRIAIGVPWKEIGTEIISFLRIYEENNREWIQVGSDLIVDLAESGIVSSVSISKDGKRVAIGSYDFKDYSGLARIYEEHNGEWRQMGSNIVGDHEGDHLGISISLSQDAKRLAVGAPWNDTNGNSSGQVKIYDISESPAFVSDQTKEAENILKIFPNPSSGVFHIETEEDVQHLNITDLSGKIIKVISANTKGETNISVDLNGLDQGIFILQAKTKLSTEVIKLIKL